MPYDVILPIFGSLIAGALIGLEREFRGRAAGFRTHLLICFASALLMAAAARQLHWDLLAISPGNVVTDPTRMAHGILTGIGFLCGGVIFREGFTVHGVTTAASLWVTAAIGILFGVGMWEFGAAATVLVLVALAGLRVLDQHIPHDGAAEVRIRYLRDLALSEAELRTLFSDLGLRSARVGHRLLDEGRLFEHVSKVRAAGEVKAAALANRLKDMPQVLEFEVLPFEE